jgi:hypothetical protein
MRSTWSSTTASRSLNRTKPSRKRTRFLLAQPYACECPEEVPLALQSRVRHRRNCRSLSVIRSRASSEIFQEIKSAYSSHITHIAESEPKIGCNVVASVSSVSSVDKICAKSAIGNRQPSRWDRRDRRQSRDGKRRTSWEASEFQSQIRMILFKNRDDLFRTSS